MNLILYFMRKYKMDSDCGKSIIDCKGDQGDKSNKSDQGDKEDEYVKVYSMGWDVGCHTSFSGKMYDTLKTSIDYGAYTTQFFMGNPYQHKRTSISQKDLRECTLLLDKFPMNVFTHYSLSTNLVGSVSSLAWSGDSEQDSKTEKVIDGINHELATLSNFNGGVVVHPGSYKNIDLGLKSIIKTINKIDNLNSTNSKLVLENSAGQGTTLARTLEEIKIIIDGVEPKKRNNIGVCIDTCHTFAHGKYDFSNIEGVNIFFSDFERIIGLDKLSLFHLNDSIFEKGCKMDRHACIGTGCIWRDSFDGLVHFLDRCKKLRIPGVLETHGRDMVMLAKLYEIYKD